MTSSDPNFDPDHRQNTTLPEPVRDHLGQQLRAVYPVASQQPKFLGDEETVPEVFVPQLERLETRLKTHEEGTEAVGQALDRILDAFGVAQETAPKAGTTPPAQPTPRAASPGDPGSP